MSAFLYATASNDGLSSVIKKLSSGLAINSAADNPSGLTIADNLASQKNALVQSIKNANDGIGMMQIAQGAINIQIKIANTIRTKANQAAQDGQSIQARSAIQEDIARLMKQLDGLAENTTYNGIQLLDGSFTNKRFQVGDIAGQLINVSIQNTNSNAIGTTVFQTSSTISSSGSVGLKFFNADNSVTTISSVALSHSSNTGLGQLANSINMAQMQTGIRATYSVVSTGSSAVAAGNISNLIINGVTIGSVMNIKANDSSGALTNSINQFSTMTGVVASIDNYGRLTLTSKDGRGIDFSGAAASGFGTITGFATTGGNQQLHNMGRLTLIKEGGGTIKVSGGSSSYAQSINFSNYRFNSNLRKVSGVFSSGAMVAAGWLSNKTLSSSASTFGYSGVTTMAGSQMTLSIAQSALLNLYANITSVGAAMNQMSYTLNNISVMNVNVAASESQLRDADFAEQSSQFSKFKLLSQTGTYAMTYAKTMQDSIMRLLM